MLEECRDMTEPRIQSQRSALGENQYTEPNYSFISLCYFPVEKSQKEKKSVGKAQKPPLYLCDSLPRSCYWLGALPVSLKV